MKNKNKMSETKKEITEENSLAVIENKDGKMVPVSELLEQLKNATVGEELGSDYFTLQAPGETTRAVFIEMTTMNKIGGAAGELTDAIRLLGDDGRKKICADKVLVSICRQLADKGERNVPIEITFTKWKQTGKGKYKEFLVTRLDL